MLNVAHDLQARPEDTFTSNPYDMRLLEGIASWECLEAKLAMFGLSHEVGSSQLISRFPWRWTFDFLLRCMLADHVAELGMIKYYLQPVDHSGPLRMLACGGTCTHHGHKQG